jgi:hypothetical protein
VLFQPAAQVVVTADEEPLSAIDRGALLYLFHDRPDLLPDALCPPFLARQQPAERPCVLVTGNLRAAHDTVPALARVGFRLAFHPQELLPEDVLDSLRQREVEVVVGAAVQRGWLAMNGAFLALAWMEHAADADLLAQLRRHTGAPMLLHLDEAAFRRTSAEMLEGVDWVIPADADTARRVGQARLAACTEVPTAPDWQPGAAARVINGRPPMAIPPS